MLDPLGPGHRGCAGEGRAGALEPTADAVGVVTAFELVDHQGQPMEPSCHCIEVGALFKALIDRRQQLIAMLNA